MLGFLEIIRELIIYHNQLIVSVNADERTIEIISNMIADYREKVNTFLKSQPRVTKIVLYLYYLKALPWKEVQSILGLTESDGEREKKIIAENCLEWDKSHFRFE